MSGIKKGNKHLELYNLEVDQTESHDVSSSYPEVVSEIFKKMAEAHKESPVEVYRM